MTFMRVSAFCLVLAEGVEFGDRKRPNIVFLMADSMDGRVVDSGTPQSASVELPFLRDFFAEKGTSFVRTYSNSPQCVPSRASMCTGRRTDQMKHGRT